MRRGIAGALAAVVLLAGCATVSGAGGQPELDARDPFEPWNRAVFGFNEAVDKAVLQPVARGYRAAVPELVRQGVDNFFGNLGDAWSTFNLVLQAKPQRALEMGMRFGTNTVLGFGGLFDLATDMGLERQSEDFGQTLGRWGVGPGPYVVITLLGPSTMRDSLALTADMAASPSMVFGEGRDRASGTVLQFVSTRARLLGATKTLDDIALDKYTLLRDGTFARRRNLVYDGEPPDEEETPATPDPSK